MKRLLLTLAISSIMFSSQGQTLVGHWTFESGQELVDQTGNFSPLTLHNGAAVSGGQLHVLGGNPQQYARGVGYTGPTLRSKTLYAKAVINDLNVRSGSLLTIDRTNTDLFDGIVYAEFEPFRWVLGSNNSSRRQNLTHPLSLENTPGVVVHMAITFEDLGGTSVRIKYFRNGIKIGDYVDAPIGVWSGSTTEIFMGIRHTIGTGIRGNINASIDEARLYDGVLSESQIASLSGCGGTNSFAGVNLRLNSGSFVFDTDLGTVNGSAVAGFDGTAFNYNEIHIGPCASVTAQGSQALVFNSASTAVIDGNINANGGNGIAGLGCNSPGGAGGLAGAGGFAGGAGGGTNIGTIDGQNGFGPGGGFAGIGDDAGGGGAGHLNTGTVGQDDGSGTRGNAGVAYASLPPLIGGSGGGGGSVDNDNPSNLDPGDDGGGGGGGGGGAISISAIESLAVSGTISCRGGNGAIGNCSSGAGGGGSGGVIQLSSCNNAPVVTGSLDVSGGIGSTSGSNGGNGSLGRVLVFQCEPVNQIPTLSEWGLIFLFLAFLSVGSAWMLAKRREAQLA